MNAPTANLLDIAVTLAEGTQSPESLGDFAIEADTVVRLVDEPADLRLRAFDAILVGPHAGLALAWLRAHHVLEVMLPEVSALVAFHEGFPAHHKDLWAHTIEVLMRTPADADLRWVALLHDIGKVATRRLSADSQVTFTRHEQLGVYLFGGIAARFGFPAARAERIAFIMAHHGRVNAYESGWTDRAVRRLSRDLCPHLDDILAFAGADFTTKRPNKQAQIRDRLRELISRLDEVREANTRRDMLPKGVAQSLIDDLALKPGPMVGAWMAWLERWAESKPDDPQVTVAQCVDAVRQAMVAGHEP